MPENETYADFLETEIKPFIVHLGDVFEFAPDSKNPLRVITNIQPVGSIFVSAAVPVKDEEGKDFFRVFGSTHHIADVKNIVDTWDIDRIVEAYRRGLEILYASIPESDRQWMIESQLTEFRQNILDRERERMITIDDLKRGIEYINNSKIS